MGVSPLVSSNQHAQNRGANAHPLFAKHIYKDVYEKSTIHHRNVSVPLGGKREGTANGTVPRATTLDGTIQDSRHERYLPLNLERAKYKRFDASVDDDGNGSRSR